MDIFACFAKGVNACGSVAHLFYGSAVLMVAFGSIPSLIFHLWIFSSAKLNKAIGSTEKLSRSHDKAEV